MALSTFCSNVVNVFTHCSRVVAIYTHCSLVWPNGPIPPGTYYVSWLPSYISSGTFSMHGSTYNYSDYSNGLYTWSSPGTVTRMAFWANDDMTYMETNVKSISDYAFARCHNLVTASMSKCIYLDSQVFWMCSGLQNVYAPRVKSISYGTFYGCTSLESIELPKCEVVGASAFDGCTSLQYASLPVCKSISTAAFQNCYSLSSIYIPECEYLEYDVFYHCHNLTSLNLPNCKVFAGCNDTGITSISLPVCETVNQMQNCYALESIDLPVCKSIDSHAFSSCTLLSHISLPECSFIGSSAFENTGLREVSLPKCSKIYHNTFKDCASLRSVYLGDCEHIANGAFSNNYTLSLMVISGSSVCGLGNAFSNTPFENCSGSIYVPISLFGQYKRTSDWSSYICVLNTIYSLPGSYYITWTPSTMSGDPYFVLDGASIYANDFNGTYSYFNGVMTESACGNIQSLSTLETNAYRVESGAFMSVKFSTVSLPACEYVGYGAFMNCSLLTNVSLPVCSYIGDSVFYGCSKLSIISLPECEYVGYRTFYHLSSLSSVDLPKCKYIEASAFDWCTSLATINLPECEYISHYAFYFCSALTSLDLPVCSYIGSQFIYGGYSSITLTLGSTSVCVLDGELPWNFSGSIYVPASLVNDYKTAQNWSQYSSQIYPIE